MVVRKVALAAVPVTARKADRMGLRLVLVARVDRADPVAANSNKT